MPHQPSHRPKLLPTRTFEAMIHWLSVHGTIQVLVETHQGRKPAIAHGTLVRKTIPGCNRRLDGFVESLTTGSFDQPHCEHSIGVSAADGFVDGAVVDAFNTGAGFEVGCEAAGGDEVVGAPGAADFGAAVGAGVHVLGGGG